MDTSTLSWVEGWGEGRISTGLVYFTKDWSYLIVRSLEHWNNIWWEQYYRCPKCLTDVSLEKFHWKALFRRKRNWRPFCKNVVTFVRHIFKPKKSNDKWKEIIFYVPEKAFWKITITSQKQTDSSSVTLKIKKYLKITKLKRKD